MEQRKGYIVLLVLMAVAVFIELIFSNLGTLFNASYRAELATLLGVTDQQETTRLVILSVFDLVAGVGVLLLLIAALRPDQAKLITPGSWLALIGYVGYGVYQIIDAFTIIDPTYRTVLLVAVFYIGLGVIAFMIGLRLKRA
jgi:hypothetical protein